MDIYELIKKLAGDAARAEAEVEFYKAESQKYKEWWHSEMAEVSKLKKAAEEKSEAQYVPSS